MSDAATETPSTDSRILPFLPMLYVAWADGDLESDEIGEIRSRLSSAEGLESPCRRYLESWLDAARPPSARDLRTLLSTLRVSADRLSSDEKLSLVDLGVELARANGHEVGMPERVALQEIGQVLGLGKAEISPRLFAEDRPRSEVSEPEAAFDVGAMTRLLDGEYRDLRVELRALLSGDRFAYVYGLDRHAYRDRVLEWCRILADNGVGALAYPADLGGRDDMGAAIAAAEVIGLHDLSLFVKYGVQFGLFAGSVYQLGTGKHHRRYLPGALSLELPGCFAMTETDHGSNVAEVETVARYDREAREFILHTPHGGARKDYIGNAARHGRIATVFAQLEIGGESHGVHAFLVPVRGENGEPLPGVYIEDCGEKLGLNGVDNGRLGFDRVRVPLENLLDRFAQVAPDGSYSSPIASPSKRFFTMLGTLVGGRVTVACVSLSAAKSALAIAVRYGARRRQFGPPGEAEVVILDYLTHQRRLMPRLAATYALDFALWHLKKAYAESSVDDRRAVEALAAGLKALATWHATETIQTCREACGGSGYLALNRFASLKADSDVFTTFEGDNTVLLQLLAKGLLSGFKKQFEAMDVFAVLRFLAGRAAEVMGEYVSKHVVDEDRLRGREFQVEALRFREDHLLGALARRLKRRIDGGMDGFHALIDCQDHVVATAKAHVERVVAERFAMAIEEVDDERLAAILATLRDLYALWRIEADRAFFLEHGYFDSPTAKAVRNLVNRLCREVRGQAVPLVDAFGIPDAVLGAPIAV